MIRQLRQRFPETEIVVLTTEESPLFAETAIGAGATGFVVDRADLAMPEPYRPAPAWAARAGMVVLGESWFEPTGCPPSLPAGELM